MDLESIKELLLSPRPSEECLAGVAGFLDFAYIEGKSKNNFKARLDLQDMKIRPELHPKNKPTDEYFLLAASYTMSKKEKHQFFKVLHDIKVPDSYLGN